MLVLFQTRSKYAFQCRLPACWARDPVNSSLGQYQKSDHHPKARGKLFSSYRSKKSVAMERMLKDWDTRSGFQEDKDTDGLKENEEKKDTERWKTQFAQPWEPSDTGEVTISVELCILQDEHWMSSEVLMLSPVCLPLILKLMPNCPTFRNQKIIFSARGSKIFRT